MAVWLDALNHTQWVTTTQWRNGGWFRWGPNQVLLVQHDIRGLDTPDAGIVAYIIEVDLDDGTITEVYRQPFPEFGAMFLERACYVTRSPTDPDVFLVTTQSTGWGLRSVLNEGRTITWNGASFDVGPYVYTYDTGWFFIGQGTGAILTPERGVALRHDVSSLMRVTPIDLTGGLAPAPASFGITGADLGSPDYTQVSETLGPMVIGISANRAVSIVTLSGPDPLPPRAVMIVMDADGNVVDYEILTEPATNTEAVTRLDRWFCRLSGTAVLAFDGRAYSYTAAEIRGDRWTVLRTDAPSTPVDAGPWDPPDELLDGRFMPPTDLLDGRAVAPAKLKLYSEPDPDPREEHDFAVVNTATGALDRLLWLPITDADKLGFPGHEQRPQIDIGYWFNDNLAIHRSTAGPGDEPISGTWWTAGWLVTFNPQDRNPAPPSTKRPPLRQFQRNDGARAWGSTRNMPSSLQKSIRQGRRNTYLRDRELVKV